jgi:hypothetical protein
MQMNSGETTRLLREELASGTTKTPLAAPASDEEGTPPRTQRTPHIRRRESGSAANEGERRRGTLAAMQVKLMLHDTSATRRARVEDDEDAAHCARE